jgi:hypothetical protein
MNLKRIYVDERPELKNYLQKISFSLDQVISIETVPVADSVVKHVFKGLGFVFAVEAICNAPLFKPSLHFNEICIEGRAG